MLDEMVEIRAAAQELLREWRSDPAGQPELLMEIASVDKGSKGAIAWKALTLATAAGEPQPATISALCKAGVVARPRLYAMMNEAMQPAMRLERGALEFLGLHSCERASELARAVARSMRECGFRGEREGGDKNWLRVLMRG